MSDSKKTGSLRDFRIDSLSKSTPIESTTRQTVRPRQSPSHSSANEWEQETPSFNSEQLWKVWEEELHETPLKTPPLAPIPSASNQSTLVSKPYSPQIVENTSQQSSTHQQEDILVPKGPLPWAASLAHTERRMERLGEVEYSNSFKKQETLKIQTAEFMNVLRQEFSKHIEIFNAARHSGAHAVHLYRITNTEHDFMLFRNSIKLVISGQRSGRILFAFNQFLGQIYTPAQSPTFELEAQWGAFEQLFWTYRNERVQVQDIVRFFTSEFVRQSYK